MDYYIVRVVCAADGTPTPHDGRYVAAWDPHTAAGTLALTSTDHPYEAQRFASVYEVTSQWMQVSDVEPVRPWDGEPNRPLRGVTIECEHWG